MFVTSVDDEEIKDNWEGEGKYWVLTTCRKNLVGETVPKW